MRRSTKVQLFLFIGLALIILPLGTRYALGSQFLSLGTIGLGDKPINATAYFDNARGLGPGTVVTFQGAVVGEIGTIDAVPPDEVQTVDTPDGPVPVPVRIDFQLDPGVEVPKRVTPVSTTLNIAGLVNLELRPTEDVVPGELLTDGDVLMMDPDLQRANFRQVLVSVNNVVDELDVEGLRKLMTALGETFRGRGEDIGDIIDNVGEISDVFDKHADTVEWLGTEGPATMQLLADASDSLPTGFSAFRIWSQQLIQARPDLEHLIDTGPGGLQRISDIIVENQDSAVSMLEGLGDVAPILADREAAMLEMVGDLPASMRRLGDVGRDGIADFALVATQGPVCYYDTPRRTVGDTSLRAPNLGVYCPPGENVGQRGAATAPRPNGLGLVGFTTPGMITGPPIVADPLLLAPIGRNGIPGFIGPAADALGIDMEGGR